MRTLLYFDFASSKRGVPFPVHYYHLTNVLCIFSRLTDVITDSTWNDGAYDVIVHKVVQDSDLLSPLPVIFDCELKVSFPT